MKAAWQYIEKHHDEYGVALFVVPVLLVGLAVISIGCGLAWLFQ
jgi:hypothetical protein